MVAPVKYALLLWSLCWMYTGSAQPAPKQLLFHHHLEEANKAMEQRDFVKAYEAYVNAFGRREGQPEHYIGAARAAAAAGNLDQCFEWIRTAIGMGFSDDLAIQTDPVFESLQTHPDMQLMLKKMYYIKEQQTISEDKDYQQRIQKMFDERKQLSDQLMALGYTDSELLNKQREALYTDIELLDSMNAVKLVELFQTKGYPTYKLLGRKYSIKAGTLWSYAPDNALLKPHYKEVQKMIRDRQCDAMIGAMLLDRILVNEGLPAIYGTALQFDKKTRSAMFGSVVHNPDTIDLLREEAGLPPLYLDGRRFFGGGQYMGQ